jgi:hypothetical protein
VKPWFIVVLGRGVDLDFGIGAPLGGFICGSSWQRFLILGMLSVD